MSSSRLPGKMLMDLDGVALVEYVFRRCCVSECADVIAVITSWEPSDDPLCSFCEESGIPVFRGALDNVLKRYIQAAKHYNLDFIGRVCGDSPFVDIYMTDRMLDMAASHTFEYISVKNSIDGLVSEIIKTETLGSVADIASSKKDYEHVTSHIRKEKNSFNTKWIDMEMKGLKNTVSLTIDQPADLLFCNSVAQLLSKKMGYNDLSFSNKDVLTVLDQCQPLQVS